MLKQDTIKKKDAWKVGNWFGLPSFNNEKQFFWDWGPGDALILAMGTIKQSDI